MANLFWHTIPSNYGPETFNKCKSGAIVIINRLGYGYGHMVLSCKGLTTIWHLAGDVESLEFRGCLIAVRLVAHTLKSCTEGEKEKPEC